MTKYIPQQRSSILTTSIIIILPITVIIISSIFLILLLLLLLQTRKNGSIFSSSSSSSFRFPSTQNLQTLNKFTLRNQTLYKYSSHPIILTHDSEIHQSSSLTKEGDVMVVNSISNELLGNEKFKVKCRGICECFIDSSEISNRKNIISSSSVYSSRMTYVVIVSVISFAFATFRNDYMHECYNRAKEYFQLNEEVDEFLTCSMENIECEKENDEVIVRTLRSKTILYVCDGHCVRNNRLKHRLAISAAAGIDCWREKGKRKVIEVEIPQRSACRRAIQVYRKLYLVPHCRSVTVRYDTVYSGYTRKNSVFPCVASHHQDRTGARNIHCKHINFLWESDA